MNLENKKALITGGNSGIGLATARLFVQAGAEVAIVGRNEVTLAQVKEELGPKAAVYRSDLLDASQRQHLFEELGEQFSRLDVVYANAGINLAPTKAGEASEDIFDRIFLANVHSAFFTVNSALPLLNDGASIIFTGSVLSTLGLSGSAAYAGAKAAIRAIVRTLATELSPRGIRVNLISPGPVKTPKWSKTALPAEAAEKLAAKLASTIPSEGSRRPTKSQRLRCSSPLQIPHMFKAQNSWSTEV